MPELRIVVADDEQDMRDYLKRVLERLGHRVLGPVSNGRELVDLCQTEEYDLIITDVRMPEMDGDEALRTVYPLRPTPFIVVSAFEFPDRYLDTFPGNGNRAFLSKPFRMNDLVHAIARITSSH